jgi:hypothetical protein
MEDSRMYGLINKAVEGLICSNFGEDTWEAIKQKAGIDVDAFISMDTYSDDVTYRLVGAASEHLNLPAEDVLRTFGEYWVIYTSREGYGDLMKMTANSFPSFLQNLNQLHTRVALSFPQLQPPSFHCTDITDHSLRLHYYSSRPGLAPLVVGLVQGLGKTFNQEVHISQDVCRSTGADHDEFVVQFADA